MKLEDTPWFESTPLIEHPLYYVFEDKYAVTKGHLLFVPKEDTDNNIKECYMAAYEWGMNLFQKEVCDGFNVGQNVGIVAGQTVMWPHIHMIPRTEGDCADPRGGVRGVIPEKQQY
jgi:diadenosine tetraphosphate (Ap4A) HIT family hydrolase